MSDSIEKIADEIMRLVQHGATVDWRPNMAEIATRLRALSPAGGDWVMVPPGLLERVKAAEDRINAGHCIRRIPADPTDPDLVMCEVRLWLEGRDPPRWIKPAASPQQEPGAKVAVVDTTIAEEIPNAVHGDRYGIDWIYHDDQRGYLYTKPAASGQTLAGAGGEWVDRAIRVFIEAGFCDEFGKPHPGLRATLESLTATSAGTTGDDSEDAARYRWLRTCGVADDRAIHTRGYSELLSESELDAAIDARRAREAG